MTETLNTRPLVDIHEAARQLNLRPPTLRRFIREGRLAGVRCGRLWKFDPADLAGFIALNKVASAK